jgi:hypothetical protein
MKRIIAGVVVALLAVGVVAGAFLLPAGAHDDHPDLQAAVERTLEAPSYRMTAVVRGKVQSVNDYVAPDRLRTTAYIAGAPEYRSIAIGDTSYVAQSCGDRTPPVRGYTRNRLPGTATAADSGRSLSALLTRATEVNRSGSSEGVTTFTFTPPRLESRTPKLEVQLSDGVATVQHSRLRSVEFTVTTRSQGKTRTVRARDVFSHYGAGDPIDAPPADRILPSRDPCGTGIDIDLTPGKSNG